MTLRFHGPQRRRIAAWTFAATLLALTAPNPALASVRNLFQTAHPYATGGGAWDLAVVDMNGDSRPDVVTANRGAYRVSVLLGNGDGSFAPRQDLFLDYRSPWSLGIGDLNHDSKPDLVTPTGAANSIAVALGNGNGTFGAPTYLASHSTPSGVALADLNGDTHLDAVITYQYDAQVTVLLGVGNGAFGAPANFSTAPLAGTYPLHNEIALGYVDGDAALDVVVSGADSVRVLLGHGDGTFGPKRAAWAGGFTEDVTLADWNQDGFTDVITPSSVLLGAGDGTFTLLASDPDAGAGVAVADLDGDGKLDRARTRNMGSQITVTSQETFPARDWYSGPSPKDVALVDVDGDGRADLVSTNHAGDASVDSWITVRRGHGDGTFDGTSPTPGGGCVAATADMNEDGHPDVVTAGPFVRLGNGAGGLGPVVDPSPFYTADLVAIGSFGPDAHVDVVTVNGSALRVWNGAGNGTIAFPSGYVSAGNASALAVGDVSGDGHDDVLTLCDYCQFINRYDGNGFGSISQVGQLTTNPAPGAMGIGLIDADALPDIVVSGSPLKIFFGNGTTSSLATSGSGLFLADLDGGPLDLGVSDAVGLTTLLGHGDGTFTALPVANGLTATGVADLDGDGKQVLFRVKSGAIVVHAGNGDGTFGPETAEYIVEQDVLCGVQAADMNGDGAPELIVGGSTPASRVVTVLLNQQSALTGVAPRPAGRFALAASPNPASRAVTLSFESAAPCAPRLEIFDPAGRRVAAWSLGALPAGAHRASWNGRLETGRRAGPGVYQARLLGAGALRSARFVWLDR